MFFTMSRFINIWTHVCCWVGCWVAIYWFDVSLYLIVYLKLDFVPKGLDIIYIIHSIWTKQRNITLINVEFIGKIVCRNILVSRLSAHKMGGQVGGQEWIGNDSQTNWLKNQKPHTWGQEVQGMGCSSLRDVCPC